MTGVYQILCLENKKFYIGSAVNIEERFARHKRMLNGNYHHNQYLQRAWDKYGEDAFEFILIELTDKQSLLVREQYWLDVLKASENGFNIRKTANSNLGLKFSEEHKKNISLGLIGVMVGSKHPNFGKPLSEQQKKNLSGALKGLQRSSETIKKIVSTRIREKTFVGEKNPAAKLTWDDIREMRRLYKETDLRYKELALLFNVSVVLVGGIIRGERWKDD